jgi:hypothetical protein
VPNSIGTVPFIPVLLIAFRRIYPLLRFLEVLSCFCVSHKIQFNYDRNTANRALFSVVQKLARSTGTGAHQHPYPPSLSRQHWRCETNWRGRLITENKFWSRLSRYFTQHGQTLVVLLADGDKRTQDRDIRKALKLAREL